MTGWRLSRRDKMAALSFDVEALSRQVEALERALAVAFDAAELPDPFPRRQGHLRVIDGGRAQGSRSALAEAVAGSVLRAVPRAAGRAGD